jgi:hypothetical protein
MTNLTEEEMTPEPIAGKNIQIFWPETGAESLEQFAEAVKATLKQPDCSLNNSTEQEIKTEHAVIDALVTAHNLFLELPQQHPMDQSEWTAKLHDLQRIIMSREAVRNHKEIYFNQHIES